MIARFFKKRTQKKAKEKKKMSSQKVNSEGKKDKIPAQKILTAEGWKRLMMRKYGKGKKT